MSRIRIEYIKINEGRREVDPAKVKELADSIKEVGLINPITVKYQTNGANIEYILIAGMHRLEAVKSLGNTNIDANVITNTDVNLELIEIDENLIRNELNYSEIDQLTLRRKEIYEEMYPETKASIGADLVKKRWDTETESDLVKRPSFVTDTANKTGKSETVIKESIYRGTHLIPEAKGITQSITKTDATDLARQAPEQQKKVVDLISTKQAKNYKEAKQILTPEEKWLKDEYKKIDKEHDNHRLVASLINETKFLKIDEQAVDDYLRLVAVDCFKTDFAKNCDRLISKLNEMKVYHDNLIKIRRIK